MTKDRGGWLDAAHPTTRAIRAGITRTPEGEHSEPIFATSSFIFESAEDAAEKFLGQEGANVYSRYTNPTVRMLEQRLAALEQGEVAVATASGMAAILSVCMAFLQSGDRVVCSRDVFGSTVGLFHNYMSKFGVDVCFVPLTDFEAWEREVTSSTKLVFCESPSNPLCEVADLKRLADLTHRVGAKFVVDNCFCTPALQTPLALGADIIIHSATKYLDGQGRVLGGAAVGSAQDMAAVTAFVRTCGPAMSPFNAWVVLKGLETLFLRMEAHSHNAQKLAEWLVSNPQVLKVHYAGLADHQGHSLASMQQSHYGGVLSFEIKGGRDAAWRFINGTELMSLTANLGDVKTTIVHPATTTHGRLSDEQRSEAGIAEGLIRIAVGLEHFDDLRKDCDRGFGAL